MQGKAGEGQMYTMGSTVVKDSALITLLMRFMHKSHWHILIMPRQRNTTSSGELNYAD